jgi:alkaline phosphatase D
LKGAAGAGAILIAAPFLLRHAAAQPWRSGDPFSLGVAAGAPRQDGFVLWTRLAPDPLSADPATPGGMHGGDVSIGYEIATDSGLRNVVRRGEAIAEQEFAYSVHLDVAGLEPNRPYWYRFTNGDAASRLGGRLLCRGRAASSIG